MLPFDHAGSAVAVSNSVDSGPVYDYAVNIAVNPQRIPGRVAGIFLHVTDGNPTWGCVAIGRDEMRSVLTWLDPSTSPEITIGVSQSRRWSHPGRDIATPLIPMLTGIQTDIDRLRWATSSQLIVLGRGDSSAALFARILSGLSVVVERRCVAHRDKQTLGAQQPRGGLRPWFGAGLVDEPVALGFELLRRGGHVGDFELDTRLGNREIRRPFGGAEAGDRRVCERPQPEVFGAL